ncbi:hypothetical protein LY71_1213 [Geodermatophilus tzadiensis]|uniref:Uncharacterized protein n=1 Tax=Geodermatophilus tzadiensis TaxID=1137988 RepID=A0A2T0T0Z9_9ACTN|nr:hypothetical protein LY71_1213 [Geodermatophilus tzadiensis]
MSWPASFWATCSSTPRSPNRGSGSPSRWVKTCASSMRCRPVNPRPREPDEACTPRTSRAPCPHAWLQQRQELRPHSPWPPVPRRLTSLLQVRTSRSRCLKSLRSSASSTATRRSSLSFHSVRVNWRTSADGCCLPKANSPLRETPTRQHSGRHERGLRRKRVLLKKLVARPRRRRPEQRRKKLGGQPRRPLATRLSGPRPRLQRVLPSHRRRRAAGRPAPPARLVRRAPRRPHHSLRQATLAPAAPAGTPGVAATRRVAGAGRRSPAEPRYGPLPCRLDSAGQGRLPRVMRTGTPDGSPTEVAAAGRSTGERQAVEGLFAVPYDVSLGWRRCPGARPKSTTVELVDGSTVEVRAEKRGETTTVRSSSRPRTPRSNSLWYSEQSARPLSSRRARRADVRGLQADRRAAHLTVEAAERALSVQCLDDGGRPLLLRRRRADLASRVGPLPSSRSGSRPTATRTSGATVLGKRFSTS